MEQYFAPSTFLSAEGNSEKNNLILLAYSSFDI